MIALPTYTPTNPMGLIADFYGLDWDELVSECCGGDFNVNYGQTKSWDVLGVHISLYRMPSGSYEITSYKTK